MKVSVKLAVIQLYFVNYVKDINNFVPVHVRQEIKNGY